MNPSASPHLQWLFIVVILTWSLSSQAQNVGINDDSSTPNSHAMLHVQSTSKGFLMPRVTTSLRTAMSLASTENGLMVFDTDEGKFYYWTGSAWSSFDISSPSMIQDTDADTKIQVEESADEDIIRFDLGGAEYFQMNKGRLLMPNADANIFIGDNAGNTSTTGSSNTGIGMNVFQNNTSGIINLALGTNAMASNTTGSYNAGLGNSSLRFNTAGIHNVSMGYSSMRLNTTGSYNTAIGNLSMSNNLEGEYNTTLGYAAMYNSEANNTVGIGSKAGYQAGDAGIYIGYEAGYSETGSNKLYIENSNSTTPLIYGEFDNDLLRVNGTLNINSAYSLPTVDGSASGQVLTTDGAGIVSWSDISLTLIEDVDADTKIQVEESSDEDVIRFDVAGTEYFRFHKGRIDLLNNGESVFIGENAGANDDFSTNANIGIGHNSLNANEIGIANVGVGSQTLQLATGNANTALGAYSMDATTTGTLNTAVGAYTMRSNTTGYANIAIGYLSLNVNKTGNANVGVGSQTLQLATGNANTAIGAYSMDATTTGTINTAVGASTMRSNTTGSANVAVGYLSLDANKTGSGNVGVGSQTLQLATGGSNTAIGAYSMDATTTGTLNTAVGTSAMRSNTTGYGNIAVGYFALSANTSGFNNTSLGFGSGENNTGSSNVFVGYQAGYSETGSNKLYIENSNSTTPLIYGEFDNDLLRVNGTLNINSAYSLPTVDGTASGQVLTTDGAGTVSWSDISLTLLEDADADTKIQVEESSDEDIIRFDVSGTELMQLDANGLLVYGTYTGGTVPDLGAGSRMTYYPATGSFRAGYVDGTQWDDASVGNYSVALGYNSIASGAYSLSVGQSNTASGGRSVALGQANTASGARSTAFGQANTASGDRSLATGQNTEASGSYSVSHGYDTKASAQSSATFGTYTTASGNQSAAFGWQTVASGYETAAFGSYTEAHDYGEMVLGQYNIVGTGNQASSGVRSGENYFTIGNGSSTTPRNAFYVEKNGNTFVGGQLTINGNGEILNFPTTDGTSGQVFTTDGSGSISWTTMSMTLLEDADADTKIQVEESADEDVIRFDMAGTEYFTMEGPRLSILNSSNSILIGTNTGLNDGGDNILIGKGAGEENTGTDNIMIGRNTGDQTGIFTAGDKNIYIGQSSGSFNDGSMNVSLGHNALTYADNVSNITAIGAEAGFNSAANSNGANSVFVGTQAGYQGSKNNNVFLGYQSGYSLPGEGNIFLGYQSGYSETGDNKLYIENSNSTTPLIYGEFDNDLLRVNGTLNINSAYSLPTVDGTSSQVLTTDGAGNVSWAASGDNLGNHTATTNIQLSGNWLSNDGGNEGVYIDASGNVGIGSNTPQTKMDIDGTLVVGGRANALHNTSANGTDLNGNEGIILPGNTSQYIINVQDGNGRIQHKWNATYGTGEQFLAGGEDASMIDWKGNTSGGNWMEFKFADGSAASAGDAISWNTHMVLDEDGNVGIGTDDPNYILTVNGEPAANGFTSFTNYSDFRLKRNIEEVGSTLDRIKQLRPVSFHYNEKSGYDAASLNTRFRGFIAQELKEVFPEMVGEMNLNGEAYLDANLSSLPIYLVKAIQEQQGLIEDLQQEAATTKSENTELKAKLHALQNQVTEIKKMLQGNQSIQAKAR